VWSSQRLGNWSLELEWTSWVESSFSGSLEGWSVRGQLRSPAVSMGRRRNANAFPLEDLRSVSSLLPVWDENAGYIESKSRTGSVQVCWTGSLSLFQWVKSRDLSFFWFIWSASYCNGCPVEKREMSVCSSVYNPDDVTASLVLGLPQGLLGFGVS